MTTSKKVLARLIEADVLNEASAISDAVHFKSLYCVTETGQLRMFTAHVKGSRFFVVNGLLKGKRTTSAGIRCGPKNEGKKSATTAQAQALLEAYSKWKYMLKRKYFRTKKEARENADRFSPMLAHRFQDHGAKISFPCFGQVKVDGVRCIAHISKDDVKLFTREGLPINLPHISNAIAKLRLPAGTILDGELYKHGVKFQTLSSWSRHPENRQTEYHVYDVPRWAGDTDTWDRRRQWLENHLALKIARAFKKGTRLLQIVECELILKRSKVKTYLRSCLQRGYEGCMLRNRKGKYKHSRSFDLQKFKKFVDTDCVVVGAHGGKGKHHDLCIFTARMPDGTTFDVVPIGEEADRREYLKKRKRYIGKTLIVRYFELYADGSPRFPVGHGFRMKGT